MSGTRNISKDVPVTNYCYCTGLQIMIGLGHWPTKINLLMSDKILTVVGHEVWTIFSRSKLKEIKFNLVFFCVV